MSLLGGKDREVGREGDSEVKDHFFIVYLKRSPLKFSMFTSLLHKDTSESNGYSHKKAVPNLFGILSKGHSWIDPGDDIDFTAVLLWLRV
jgi:hypothetical protein